MKQYKRGIQAYQTVATGKLVKTEDPDIKTLNSSFEQKGLYKTTVQTLDRPVNKENKFTRIAKLLLVLGKEEASKVITHLPAGDIEKI